MSMFCYQCQEAAQGVGCTIKGVCGKTPEVAGLQDLLVYQLKGLSVLSVALRQNDIEFPAFNRFVVDGLFMTITNANFDDYRFESFVRKGFEWRNELRTSMAQAGIALENANSTLHTWNATTR